MSITIYETSSVQNGHFSAVSLLLPPLFFLQQLRS